MDTSWKQILFGKANPKLMLKTILLCSDHVKKPIPPEALTVMQNWDPAMIVNQEMGVQLMRDYKHLGGIAPWKQF